MRGDQHDIPRHLDAPILWYWFRPFEAKVVIGTTIVLFVSTQQLLGLVAGVVVGFMVLKKIKRFKSKHGEYIFGRWRYFCLPKVGKDNSALPLSYIREFVG